MQRDPFYRQIIEKLQGTLDPDLFEDCAADLLRAAYPTLVPIRGGTDAGMDGAIADAEGEPFPLVTTTSKDVIGNLTRNLNSYLKQGGTRHKAVLVTSQNLTPRKIQNLYKRASELGFLLLNIHAQDAIANLLYHSPEWCRELLNLTGDPSPLSVVPRTTRPQLSQSLIGRDQDLTWLIESNNDRLLVGQPGSGKTSLLRELTSRGLALFVISKDRGELAAAIRKQEPEMLIVDDAQTYQDVILDLIQLRKEIGAKFSILVSSWPSFQSKIAEILNLTEKAIHRLDLLPRDEIVTVVEAIGIHGPDELIREIVNQAQGRPGLAVTLAYLCLQGGVQELLSGDALNRSIKRIFDDLAIKQHANFILAAFSLGGDAGMSLNDVAEMFNLRFLDVWEIISQLDDSGIVFETSQKNISVQPAALRHVLVRDVFFRSAMSIPIQPLLSRVPDLAQTALTLIGAKARGGRVPGQLLADILSNTYSDQVWTEYAWLGRDEAKWILTNYPQTITTVAWPTLQHIPDLAIPLLLEKAIGDLRPLNAHPNHPFRLIGDWTKAARPHTGQAVARRKALLEAVQNWLNAKKDTDIGIYAIQYVMFPGFHFSQTDPGRGMTVTLHYGLLPIDDISAIERLWERVVADLRKTKIVNWEPIQITVETWVFPGRIGHNTPSAEVYERIHTHASRMLSDVVDLANGRLGVMHWALQMANHLNLKIEIPFDEDFRTLYPERERENWQAAAKQQATSVRKLANIWSRLEPRQVVEKLALIEEEAKAAKIHYPRWTPLLCSEIANSIKSSIPWIQAFMDIEVSGDLVAPFLNKAAQSNEPKWLEFALVCLDRPNYKGVVITLGLTLPNSPAELYERVFQELEGYSQLIMVLCLRNEVPEHTVKRLLQHEDLEIARAAAEGEWHAEPTGTVREGLQSFWREAALNCAFSEYWLEEVFKRDSNFAYQWLEAYLAKHYQYFHMHEENLKAAISVLDIEARRRILAQVPPDHLLADKLTAYLVGDNLELYRALLSSEQQRELHLSPLLGYPEGSWVEKARLALDAGYTPEKVARAVHSGFFEWSGNESNMWASWVGKFEALCSNEDERIQQVGMIGRDAARRMQEHALQGEKIEAIYGL